SVHGIIFAHFDIKDRPAAAYAMVSLMMNRVSSYLERKIIGLGVDIRLGREFNETCIAEESPDAVVVAAEDRESGTLLSDIGNGYRIAKKI
ncbi:MAG: hypothetical protein JW793_14900, partial [Acidobacteria bacterium]|nr:hypothetical protein [Acidobacteriota bacterium]